MCVYVCVYVERQAQGWLSRVTYWKHVANYSSPMAWIDPGRETTWEARKQSRPREMKTCSGRCCRAEWRHSLQERPGLGSELLPRIKREAKCHSKFRGAMSINALVPPMGRKTEKRGLFGGNPINSDFAYFYYTNNMCSL